MDGGVGGGVPSSNGDAMGGSNVSSDTDKPISKKHKASSSPPPSPATDVVGVVDTKKCVLPPSDQGQGQEQGIGISKGDLATAAAGADSAGGAGGGGGGGIAQPLRVGGTFSVGCLPKPMTEPKGVLDTSS